jgi:hypothetical protein
MNTSISRRKILMLGVSAVTTLPSLSWAAKNAGLRVSMKYVDKTEKPDQRCDNCLHWVPGASAKDLGGCKLFAGDTEINPAGWCTVWAKKA